MVAMSILTFVLETAICKNKKQNSIFCTVLNQKAKIAINIEITQKVSKVGDMSFTVINQDNVIKSRDGLSTATSTLSHIPNTSQTHKIRARAKPPPKGTKRRIGDTGQKMPAGGRLLKNPSDATLVGMKFERPNKFKEKMALNPMISTLH